MIKLRALAEQLLAIKGDTCEGSCSNELCKNGRCIVLLANPRANVIDAWVKAVAAESKVEVDWHFAGGRARVLTAATNKMVDAVARNLLPALDWAYRVTEDEKGPQFGMGLWVYWPET